MQVKLAGRLRKDSGSPSEAGSHRIEFIPIYFSSGNVLVVIGPDHGPHVDVEQGTYTTGSGDGRYVAPAKVYGGRYARFCQSSREAGD